MRVFRDVAPVQRAVAEGSGDRGTLRAEMERCRVRAMPVAVSRPVCVDSPAHKPTIRHGIERNTHGKGGRDEKGCDAKDEGDLGVRVSV